MNFTITIALSSTDIGEYESMKAFHEEYGYDDDLDVDDYRTWYKVVISIITPDEEGERWIEIPYSPTSDGAVGE